MIFNYTDFSLSFLSAYFRDKLGESFFLSPNWMLMLYTLVIIYICIVAARKAYLIPPNYKNYDPSEYNDKWKGLRKTLILLGILLAGEIVKNIIFFINGYYLYSEQLWEAVTSPGSPLYAGWWEFTIYFYIFAGIYKIIFSGLLFIIYLERKRSFRLLFVIYIISDFVFLGVKYIAFTNIFDPSHVLIYESFSDFSLALQFAIALICYVLFSRRVNATFAY
jgi:hypothetical protein